MIKTVCSLILTLFLSARMSAQITVQLSTLPAAGDELFYQSVPPGSATIKVDNQVFQTGANLQWDFSELDTGFETSESYIEVETGTAADSFPDADIAIDFLGLQGYAKRNTTDISILGVAGDSIVGFPIPIVGLLDNPFTIRRAPFGYQDQFSTNTSFNVSIDVSILDTFQEFQDLISQIPGTTVDSVRVTLSIDRSESVEGWGMVTIPSGSEPVLKMTQTDVITTTIEIYAITFLGSAWVDLSPFLPEETSDLLSVTSTSHLFFSADKKEVVAEFTMAPDSTLLSTRYDRDITSSIFGNDRFENLIAVTIYPNPTSNWVSINIESENIPNDLIIKLYNTTGQLIESQVINTSAPILDLNNFNSGIHIITIHADQKLLYRDLLMVSN